MTQTAPSAPELHQSPLAMEAEQSPFLTQEAPISSQTQNQANSPRSNELKIPSRLPPSLPKEQIAEQISALINRTHKNRRGDAIVTDAGEVIPRNQASAQQISEFEKKNAGKATTNAPSSPKTQAKQAPKEAANEEVEQELEQTQEEEPSELAEYLSPPEEEAIEQTQEEESPITSKEVDFRQFAMDNPDVIFKYPNKNAPGGYAQMSAKKAADFFANAAQLDQMAYNIKVKKAEIEEFENTKKQEFDGLLIGLETIIAPKINDAVATMKQAYEYNDQWRAWAQNNPDPASQAKAEREIEKNESIISQAAKFIEDTKPKAQKFVQIKEQKVKEELDKMRKSFKNPQLRNEVIYEKLVSDLQKEWPNSQGSLYPGVRNLDWVRSDEDILSLLSDGLKYRSGPKIQRQAGQSLSGNSSRARSVRAPSDPSADLQIRAQRGDKAAAADVISMWIDSKSRQKRG